MKKTARKVLLMACSALLLVCLTVGATVAYLTATTGVVTNTFTVGSVAITLDETDVDLYGVKDGETRVVKNSYKLINGHEYTKDPTVHVTAGSEQCFVFVKVVNPIAAYEGTVEDDPATTDIDETVKKIADQMTDNGWVALAGETNVYYYNNVVDAREAKKDLPVFAKFVIDGEVALPETAPASITIDAYAVQADGFGSAAEAWEAAEGTWEN